MSALRFCTIAIVALAASASAAMYSGGAEACGMAPAMPFFGNSSVVCVKAKKCQTDFCKCIGAAAPTNFTCGAWTNGKPNCTIASACASLKIACINVAADDNAAGCSALKDLKMSNLAVAGGQLYNGSSAFKACKYEACKMINQTAMGGNCTLDFTALCASPVKFIASMVLKGNWAVFLDSPAKKAKLQAALEKDLTKALGFLIRIIRMYIKNNRRRATDSNLLIEFEASGVSGNNADLKSRLDAIQSDTAGSFLAATLTEYKAEHGASASFTVRGISAGSASSAVFSFSTGSGSATTTTGSATSSSSTTGSSGTSSSTSSSSTGSSGSTSGAATQSLVAAVVVAVVGAMLF